MLFYITKIIACNMKKLTLIKSNYALFCLFSRGGTHLSSQQSVYSNLASIHISASKNARPLIKSLSKKLILNFPPSPYVHSLETAQHHRQQHLLPLVDKRRTNISFARGAKFYFLSFWLLSSLSYAS